MVKNYTRYNLRVESAVTGQLLALNLHFYTEHAQDFSETRARLQPGVMRVLDTLKGDESILDLGCGNGELARRLSQRGHRGSYLGLDFSPPLLRDAERGQFGFPVEFRQADLTQLPTSNQHWPLITAFALLHHIPGEEARRQMIAEIRQRLQVDGKLVLSNWQFLSSEKQKARIQPWDTIGLNTTDVDPNDYLLDWKRGGLGLRYVHHFDEAELARLARSGGFEVAESFYSDGENRRSSLYQVWKPI